MKLKVPTLVLGIALVLLVMNAAFDIGAYAIAAKTFDGLVVDHYYSHGLHYSQELKPLAESEGWKVRLQVPGAAGKASPVTVSLRDRAGTPLAGAVVSLKLFRPNRDGFDQQVALVERSPGEYAAPVTIPLQGLWQTTVDIRLGGKDCVHVEPIRVRS